MGRTRTRTAAGLVLDTGALIALDRGDKRMIALLHRALTQGRAFRGPSGGRGASRAQRSRSGYLSAVPAERGG